MAAGAGTRKRKGGAAAARSTAASKYKRARAAVDFEWVEVPPTSGSPPCRCYWCLTFPSRGCGTKTAHPATSLAAPPPSSNAGEQDHVASIQTDPASGAASLEPAPSSPPIHACEQDYTPPTAWNCPASPDYTSSIPSDYKPLKSSNFPASFGYTPASPSEYTPESSPEYTPATPSSHAWSTLEHEPLTPQSAAFSPSYTPGTPWSDAASPDYTPESPSGCAASLLDYTPRTPPPSPTMSGAESRTTSTSRSSRTRRSRVSRRRCLHTKAYLAFFTPEPSVV